MREAVSHRCVRHAVGSYVPFLFGAFVGELSLRFGMVVLALAAVSFVMVQAVFASFRAVVESERGALEGLAAAVEAKDPYTGGHSKRVVRWARYMGERLGMKHRDLARLDQHALMHDIGKLAVPNHVLRKPGKLDADERTLMLRHEAAGAAILAGVPFLALSAEIAEGRGERDGLDGPVRAMHLVHAADAFDAMTTTRPYRQAHTQEETFVEMRKFAGKHFHPACVEALIAEIEERGEVYGAGHEEEVVEFAVPPPVSPLGSTLADEAAADAKRRAAATGAPQPEKKMRAGHSQEAGPNVLARHPRDHGVRRRRARRRAGSASRSPPRPSSRSRSRSARSSRPASWCACARCAARRCRCRSS